jgi:autotransporter-associated beta strand protein
VEALEDRTVLSQFHWSATGGGSWTNPANWTLDIGPPGVGYPDNPDDIAVLGNAIIAPSTITIPGDTTITVGTINIDSNSAYTISGALGVSFPGQLNFEVTSGTASLNVTAVNGNGAHTISASINLLNSVVVSNASLGPLTLSGVIGSFELIEGLTKNGAGALVLTNHDTYLGDTVVNAGTLQVDGSLQSFTGITVNPGGTLDGTGAVGNITATGGGIVEPGHTGAPAVPGTLTAANADLSGGGNLQIVVNGIASPGSQYSVLDVSHGDLTLAGSSILTLDVAGLMTGGTAVGVSRFNTITGLPATVRLINNALNFTATPAATPSTLDVAFSAPLSGTGTTVYVAEGKPLVNVPVGTFNDPNGGSTTGNFSAVINWGDGSPSTGGNFLQAGNTFTVLGSHTYGSEGTYTISIAVHDILGRQVNITSQAIVGGFVTQLYHDLLLRAPDPIGLRGWVGALHSGVPRQVIATGIWVSAEHRGVEVDVFYRTLLHRNADPVGRAGWVNGLLAGMSEASVVAGFVNSAEYRAAHPSRTAFVSGLFQDIFGRTASAADIASFAGIIDDGAASRTRLVFILLSSDESLVDAINENYQTFLDRVPSAAEVQPWLAALRTGNLTSTQFSVLFLISQEYLVRALFLANFPPR